MSFLETAGAQFVGNTAEPAVEGATWIFKNLRKKYDYVKNLTPNYRKLEAEENSLTDREGDVRAMLERNQDRMQSTNECDDWLNQVSGKKGRIQALKKRYEDINPRLSGLWPFRSLLTLGRDIVKETQSIAPLRDRMRLENNIMIERAPAPPHRSLKKHALNIKDFPSLHVHVEEIQELLKQSPCKKICIWGPSGVGKTTIMENVHDRVGETTQFEIIFWVTVKENGCEEDIQKILEQRLGLKVEENSSQDIRAENISRNLENKSYLLFLDQVSSLPDLKNVGIHDDHTGGKIVFACNYRDNSITYDDFRIERLSNDDAQKLFNRLVSADIIRKPGINRIAELLVKECGGLPQLIKVMAAQVATVDDIAVWQDKLSQLQAPSVEPYQELEEVYRAFKIPYDKLDESKKPCLLYWAIFPVGYEIHQDYIIECWRAEQFFKGFKKLGQTRDRGHTMLDEFVKICLLDTGRQKRHYKMFENFQRVALRIANCNGGSHQLLLRKGEIIEEEQWTHVQRVSLIHHPVFSTLPAQPRCSAILTLLLQENKKLESIPASFFESMQSLQVLDLHDTRIKSLPSSISCLINLKGLYLNGCGQLQEIPADIGKLQSLEIFDLRGTRICNLPEEIKQLTNLKCLRLSFEQHVNGHNHVESQSMVIIPPQTISKLLQLEELSIGINHNNTDWNNVVNEIVDQVVGLEELTTLCFYFPKVECLDSFVSRSKSWEREEQSGSGFRSFKIVVGYHQTNNDSGFDISGCSAEKHLRFSSGRSIPDAILRILKHACSFELIGDENVTNLSVFGDKLEELEICKVEECNKMESIIDCDMIEGVAFQCLEQLHIINIPNLVHIWKGVTNLKSLSSLKKLILKGCPNLENLFSQAQRMVQLLSQLQHLEVEDCQEMKEMVETGSDVSSAFPKLQTIQLRNLPKVSTIWQAVAVEWPSLEKIEIRDCDMLKDIPSTMEKAAKLKVIACTRGWRDSLEWPSDPAVKDRFQSMFHCV